MSNDSNQARASGKRRPNHAETLVASTDRPHMEGQSPDPAHERMLAQTPLAALIDIMPDAAFLYDASGHITAMNEVARRLLGMDGVPEYASLSLRERADLLRGRLADGRPHPARDWVAARALRGETLTGDSAVDVVMTTLDGREVHVTISGAPIRDEAGEIVGAVTVLHDMTQRRQLEREAAEHAAELATLVETMPDAAALFGSDGQVLLINSAFRTLFALEQHPDFFARPVEDRRRMLQLRDVDGNPLPPERSPFERVLHGGQLVIGAKAMDIVVELPDGRLVELEVVGSPVRDGDGSVIGAVLLYRDVTEHRRLERRTRESLDAMLQMAETLVAVNDLGRSDGAAGPQQAVPDTIDAAGRRLAELTCRMLSCDRVSLVAMEPDGERMRPLAIVGLSAAQEQDWRQTAAGLRLSDYRTSGEIAQLRAGRALLVDLTSLSNAERWTYGASPTLIVPLVAGRQLVGLMTVGYGSLAHEYTAEEIALAEAAGKLVALVVEREQLLAERAEAQAEQLALADANHRMDEFLSIASHELRTPLTSIKANVQLASRQLHNLTEAARAEASGSRRVAEAMERFDPTEHAEGLPERLEHADSLLDRAERQVRRMDRLVGDLLDVSRIQAGKLELRRESCDLLPLVQEAVNEQRAAWPAREITLELPKPVQVATQVTVQVAIHADADRIGQVVTNLLSNALKYSPSEAPVEVRVRMEGVNSTLPSPTWGGGAGEAVHRGNDVASSSAITNPGRSAPPLVGEGVGGEVVRVEVRDHGPGLTKAQRRHLFERFYRVPGIEQQSGSGLGLGLGLHICKTIVERHGGQIGVESTRGRGSTFYFTLPLQP